MTIRIPNSYHLKKVINILDVIFVADLNWTPQLSETEANEALNAIKLIIKFLSSQELIQIIPFTYI